MAVRELQPDVVLMDLLMPGLDGVQATAMVKAEHPGVEVIALTSVLEDQSVVGAIRAGAIGYLLEDTRGDDLVRAIHAAAEGRVELSPAAAARLAQEVRLADRAEPRTPREADILTLVAEGFDPDARPRPGAHHRIGASTPLVALVRKLVAETARVPAGSDISALSSRYAAPSPEAATPARSNGAMP